MSDITLIDDSEQSSLVTNGLVKNGELYLKKAGSTSAGAIVAYDNGVWRTFANEAGAGASNAYSVDLDGTNDYVNVSASTDFVFGTSDFSFSVWFNPDVISGYRSVVDFRLSNADTAPSLYNSTNSGWKLYIWSGSSQILNSDATLNTGQWYHAVYTRSSGSATLYLDGESVATGTDSTNYSLSAAPKWGGLGSGVAANTFNGKLDECAVFNSALSSSDVTAIYNSGTPDDLTSYSPVGWWRMGDNDSGTGTTITDQGSGGNDGTLTNGPTFHDLSTAPDSIYVA